MCGIAGISAFDGKKVSKRAVNALAKALRHRGPDGVGPWVSDRVAILNTRLAIIDVKGGDQPFISPSGNILVANGEIYNDLSLRQGLKDIDFQSGSDCEPPLYLYQHDGPDYVRHLRGMYAIAIYDKAVDQIILSRDPFGIKQIYYASNETGLAFASEPQALVAAGFAKPGINETARAELLQLQFTTGRTSLMGVERVLPGETLIIQKGQIIERHRLPTLRSTPKSPSDEVEALRELDNHFSECVHLHMRTEVPYGLFLSGGIDSSAIAIQMKRLSNKPITALTAAFPELPKKDESEKAIRIAKAVRAEHHLIRITPKYFWDKAPHLAAIMDDPTTDASSFPLYCLSEAAHDLGLKVVLAGDGADEVFGGYKRYRRATWFFGLWRERERSRGTLEAVDGRYATLDSWRKGLSQAAKDLGNDFATRMQAVQALDCAEWLPNDLLVKLDRCLMAFSVEGRTPFVDPVFSPWAFALPDRFKVRGSTGKYLLRKWLDQALPEADVWTKKQGFVPPTGFWMAPYSDTLLKLMVGHRAFRGMGIDPLIREVISDPVGRQQGAWSLLFYALWYARHIENFQSNGNVEDVLAATR